MPIYSAELRKGVIAQVVEVNATETENLQCCRVKVSDDCEANELWFFVPVNDVQDGDLVGRLMSETGMASPPIILQLNSSAATLAIIQDLTIIYGNLTAVGK
ncbi:hypothetical protein GCM10028808_73010 [Spirosoma migulaei]